MELRLSDVRRARAGLSLSDGSPMTAHAPVVSMASRAEHVQKVVTPGGLTAWLVESYAVPLVALEFSLRGGAAQDPAEDVENVIDMHR